MLILLPAPRRHVTLCLSLLPAPRGHATLELSLLPAPTCNEDRLLHIRQSWSVHDLLCHPSPDSPLRNVLHHYLWNVSDLLDGPLLDSVLAHEKRHLENRLLHYLRKLLEGSLLTPQRSSFVLLIGAHALGLTTPGCCPIRLAQQSRSSLFFSRCPSTPSRVVRAGGT